MASTFQCPSDCGWCCTHLDREVPADEAEATAEFRGALRDIGVYSCPDPPERGLSLSPEEAAAMQTAAEARGIQLDLHPRTWLLETRRRVAVVLDWHMPHASCPMYETNVGCRAYDARPLVCRAYPVMAPSPRWRLAPECPLTEPTREARVTIKLGTFLKSEAKARRALDAAHVALDERASHLLDADGARFAKGLSQREAQARVARYRTITADEFTAA